MLAPIISAKLQARRIRLVYVAPPSVEGARNRWEDDGSKVQYVEFVSHDEAKIAFTYLGEQLNEGWEIGVPPVAAKTPTYSSPIERESTVAVRGMTDVEKHNHVARVLFHQGPMLQHQLEHYGITPWILRRAIQYWLPPSTKPSGISDEPLRVGDSTHRIYTLNKHGQELYGLRTGTNLHRMGPVLGVSELFKMHEAAQVKQTPGVATMPAEDPRVLVDTRYDFKGYRYCISTRPDTRGGGDYWRLGFCSAEAKVLRVIHRRGAEGLRFEELEQQEYLPAGLINVVVVRFGAAFRGPVYVPGKPPAWSVTDVGHQLYSDIVGQPMDTDHCPTEQHKASVVDDAPSDAELTIWQDAERKARQDAEPDTKSPILPIAPSMSTVAILVDQRRKRQKRASEAVQDEADRLNAGVGTMYTMAAVHSRNGPTATELHKHNNITTTEFAAVRKRFPKYFRRIGSGSQVRWYVTKAGSGKYKQVSGKTLTSDSLHAAQPRRGKKGKK